jgi:hypothetical protein
MIRSVLGRSATLLALTVGAVACGDGGGPAAGETLSPDLTGLAGSAGEPGPDGGAAGGEAPDGGAAGGGTGGGDGTGGRAPGGEAGGPASPSRYVTRVVSFAPGPGAGFGQSRMPEVVCGPPKGAGDALGGLDVVSLGRGGEIVVEFGENAAVDGPGADFLVFENPFVRSGGDVFRELAEVSVSDDGATWAAFPCDPARPDEGACAGRNVVYANPDAGVSALDPTAAGGDPFDLAAVGLARARFVRVRDLQTVPGGSPASGFDLDAIAIVNARVP